MGGTMRLGADPVKLHAGHARARGLRRAGHLRAPPPPLRGQQPAAAPARGRRPGVQRHLARRPPGRGDRAARPPVLRRLAVPPRVQVAPEPARAAVPRVRRRGARARARARDAARGRADGEAAERRARRAGSDGLGPRARRLSAAGAAAAGHRAERARLADTFVRAVRDREPDGREARDGRAPCGRSSRRSGLDGRRRTTRPPRPAPSAATCSRGSRGPSGARTVMLCAHIDTVPLDGPRRGRAAPTASSATAATRSWAPTTRRPSRCCSSWRARLCAERRAGRRASSSSRPARRSACAARKAFDTRPPRGRVRLRVRPRRADRRADRRGAHLLRVTRGVPRARGARRHPARRTGRSAIAAAAKAIERDAARAASTRRRPRTSA